MGGSGSLVCVGIGMTLGSHITPLARSYIDNSDVVFTGLSDGVMELWLAKMHPDVRSFQSFYREGKSRAATYQQMVDAMLAEVRAGKRVCGAFYGHPGVFAGPTHKAIELARREGYSAHMEPGVSAVTLPMHQPTIQRLPLKALPAASIDTHVTLVIPPGTSLQADPTVRECLAALDSTPQAETCPV
jgi:precorrin-6B methylase 1